MQKDFENVSNSTSTETKVWSRFQRKLRGGKTVKLKIQNVPKGKEAEVIDFMAKYFIHEETFMKAFKIADNPKSCEELKNLMNTIVETFPALVCYLDTEDECEEQPLQIIGFNCLYMSKKGVKEDLHFQTDELNEWYRVVTHPDNSNKVYDKYGVDEYLGGAGLSVHPDYRGCGIAVELLKARRPLCENLGIAVTGAVFSAVASQRAAESAGYELVFETDFKSYGDACGTIINTDEPGFKIQVMRIS